MAKIRNLSEIQQEIAFTEFGFYQRYAETFKTSELGRIKSLLPLREMAISFHLIEEHPRYKRVKRGSRFFFTQKGRADTNEVKNAVKRELARVRATVMEGSFGTQKEHHGLRKIAARIKSTEIMLIFFGIHTANAVNLAKRKSVRPAQAA